MTSRTNLKMCFLWEDELRAAAGALHRLHEALDKVDEEAEFKLMAQALQACMTALWGLDDDHAVAMLASHEIRRRLTDQQ